MLPNCLSSIAVWLAVARIGADDLVVRVFRELLRRNPNLPPERIDEVLGVLKAFALRSSPEGTKLRERWQPGIDVPVRNGRAHSGDIEIDLVELFTEVAELAQDVGSGIALLIAGSFLQPAPDWNIPISLIMALLAALVFWAMAVSSSSR